MKRLCAVWRCVLLLVTAGAVCAQGRGLPAADAVRLTPQSYINRYLAKTGNRSTAGQAEAADAFTRDRRAANEERARRELSAADRARVAALRALLANVSKLVFSYRYIRAGGGTMWVPMQAYDGAAREAFLTEILAALAKPRAADRAARERANKRLQEAARKLARMKSPPPAGGFPMEEESAEYRKLFSQVRSAWPRLTSLVAALPDRVAEKVAGWLVTELAKSEREEP